MAKKTEHHQELTPADERRIEAAQAVLDAEHIHFRTEPDPFAHERLRVGRESVPFMSKAEAWLRGDSTLEEDGGL